MTPPSQPEASARAERARRTAMLLARAATASGEQRRRILDSVVSLNLGVAEAIAARYQGRGLAAEDLTQVAYEGLVKAVHRFQPGSNELLSFAVPTIRGELRRHFRDRGWVVRPPRRVQELQARANLCAEEYRRAHGRQPSRTELLHALGVSSREYEEGMSASGCFHPASLDQTVGDRSGDTALGEVLPDLSVTRGYDGAEARVMLAPALSRLKDRDQRLVRMRFVEDLTQQQMAQALGITQTQVSKLLARVLGALRRDLGELGPPLAETD